MRILFLYTELADYTIACLNALKRSASDIQIQVIHFPINPEAPFRFDFAGIGSFTCVNDFKDYASFRHHILQYKPEKIVCCGWVNKWYLRFCYEYRKKALCVLTLDNHWEGNLKQQVFRFISALTLPRIFRNIWIPGEPQFSYARKIGFKERNIVTGFYCCDIDRFNTFYQKTNERKKQQFPHRFLCVARYIPAKGYQNLWDAFIKWKDRSPNDWELWCAGTGEDFDKRVQHPAIRHLGFVQKDEWEQIIAETGVFVLPSLYEPWGVVVQEFAATGYPLLLSDKVGASSKFLNDNNGMRFTSGNADELMRHLQAISSLEAEQLNKMAHISHQLAQQIIPSKWAHDLLDM